MKTCTVWVIFAAVFGTGLSLRCFECINEQCINVPMVTCPPTYENPFCLAYNGIKTGLSLRCYEGELMEHNNTLSIKPCNQNEKICLFFRAVQTSTSKVVQGTGCFPVPEYITSSTACDYYREIFKDDLDKNNIILERCSTCDSDLCNDFKSLLNSSSSLNAFVGLVVMLAGIIFTFK